ncbi:MAG: molybdopterin-dependent oxidoreductase [Phycisphaerales bacterium]|nr:molybdopterin-dependent oxidoreductase [Phycisphaerales bacterium]
MLTVDRREFLTAAAMAAATAAVAGKAKAVSLPVMGQGGLKWEKAPCRFCGTGCHVMVGTEAGKVVAIQGDQKAEVNRGLLCVKGYHVGLAMYGPDRLTTPMLRKNGRLEPITWDEAIDVIARRIMANPRTFAMYGSGQWTIPEGVAANKFMKGGLSNNYLDGNPRLCMASAVTGFLSTFGVDEPPGVYDDLDVCDVAIMWGNNMAEMHPVIFSRLIDRRSRGEKVMVIDLGTRRTRTTDHADEYLQFNPQSDLAIANGIAHLLLKNGTYDKRYVEKFCNFRQLDPEKPDVMQGKPMTFAEYESALAEYTPERVEQISGVPAAKIRMLGDLFGRRDLRINSLWCMGMNQHTRGTAINCLVHGIHLLSGHLGKPGDAATSLTGQPSACGTVREVGTLCHLLPGGRLIANEEHRKQAEGFWNLPEGRINPKPGYHTVLLFEKFCTPTDKGSDVQTLWVQVTNPGHSLPNLPKLFRGKKDLQDKFLIVSDVYPTATTELADLVLPSAMWVEKNGMYGNSERRTQQWFKMVDPPGQARDDCWQTIAVARRLFDLGFEGMKDKDGKFLFTFTNAKGDEVPVWDWNRYYDINVDEALFESYRPFTRMKHKDLAPYSEYVKARGLRWPVVEQPDGSWRETRWRFSEFDDPYVKKGAEMQFYHSVTKDDKALIWFRPYEAPPEVPDAEYPFWLCTGRVLEHWHTGSMTRRIPQLKRAMPESYVELNREDAVRLGVRSGDLVTITSRRAAVNLPAWIGGRGDPPKGSAFVPFFDEAMLINLVTLDAHDPFSKQPDYKKCAVSITKTV